MYLGYEPAIDSQARAINLLAREWNPDTWEFGALSEVQVPRSINGSDFAKHIQSKLFPHIPVSNLFATKVSFVKNFYRSDLVTKKWSNLSAGRKGTLAQSALEVTRDATLIIVRDQALPIREELEADLLQRYADKKYLDHLALKAKNSDVAPSKRDELFEAAQNRKTDWSQNKGKPETGVSIQVGIGSGQAQDNDDDLMVIDDADGALDDFEPFF